MGNVTGTDTGNNMTNHDDSSPAQGIETDDVTSAADADWLAALRSTARQRKTSLADVLGDESSDDSAHDSAVPTDRETHRQPDDEATIGSPTAVDDVRRLAREERTRPAPSATVPSAPSVPERAPHHASAFAVPPTLTPAPIARQQVPEDRLQRAEFDPVVRDTDGPRWQAPPRLEAATTETSPLVIDRGNTTRTADWRITALAILVALLLGVVITLLFLGGSDSAPPVDVDPDGSTVVDDSLSIDSIVDDGDRGDDAGDDAGNDVGDSGETESGG